VAARRSAPAAALAANCCTGGELLHWRRTAALAAAPAEAGADAVVPHS
jgi:hypothetical protein